MPGTGITTVTPNDLETGYSLVGCLGSASRTSDFSTTSGTYVDVTDLSVTVTPAGSGSKKLLVMFAAGALYLNGGNGKAALLAIDQDGTTKQEFMIYNTGSTGTPPYAKAAGVVISCTAGTPTTFKIQAKTDGVQALSLDVANTIGGVSYTTGNAHVMVFQLED